MKYKPTKHAQENIRWDALNVPRAVHVVVEQGIATRENVTETGCRDAGYQDGEQGSHGQIEHQNLQRKDQTGKRSFEDARDGGRSTATNQKHHRAGIHVEESSQIASYGRPCKHNRCFGAH